MNTDSGYYGPKESLSDGCGFLVIVFGLLALVAVGMWIFLRPGPTWQRPVREPLPPLELPRD